MHAVAPQVDGRTAERQQPPKLAVQMLLSGRAGGRARKPRSTQLRASTEGAVRDLAMLKRRAVR